MASSYEYTCRYPENQEFDGTDDVATGALPLAMSNSPQRNPSPKILLVPNVHVADVRITSGMRPLLERTSLQGTNSADQAQALELLTAIDLQRELREQSTKMLPTATSTYARSYRPMPVEVMRIQSATTFRNGVAKQLQRPHTPPLEGAFETTHNYFFQPQVSRPSQAIRPASCNPAIIPRWQGLKNSGSPVPPAAFDPYLTHYNTEFQGSNNPRRAIAPRAATATGTRNNNPHPSVDFLVWRQRRPLTATALIENKISKSDNSNEDAVSVADFSPPAITPGSYDKAVRGKYRTTYQSDYLGSDRGHDKRNIFDETNDKQLRVPFDKGSEHRRSYKRPSAQPKSIRTSNTRYGCTEGKVTHNEGIVPDISNKGPYMFTEQRTTYDRDVNARGLRLLGATDLVNVSAAQNHKTLARTLAEQGAGDRCPVRMRKLLHEMLLRTKPASIPLPHEHCADTKGMKSANSLSWISQWPGPVG